MTIRKFRNFDIAVLSIMVIIIDIVGVLFFKRAQISMYFAISYAVVILAYVRWNKFGLIVNGLTMLCHLILLGILVEDPIGVVLLHTLSLSGLSVFLGFKTLRKLKVWQFWEVFIGYILTYLVVFFVEYGLLNLFGYNIKLIDMGINQSFNFIFVLGILFIIYKQKSLFIDMRYYFEKREER